MKLKKKFTYEGVELRIVEREEPYLNSEDTVTCVRVLAPNDKEIPVNFKYKATLKTIEAETIRTLDSFKERGADVKSELLKA